MYYQNRFILHFPIYDKTIDSQNKTPVSSIDENLFTASTYTPRRVLPGLRDPRVFHHAPEKGVGKDSNSDKR